MALLNLGIVAHVDAGKTSLTERLLFNSSVIDEIGSVDAGTTQTDSLALEQQRGITIRSAVASFVVGDATVNLIDTPGHPDFIAEVERVLHVLDAAVLVVSAVEGIQPQTRILMRTLRRMGIPTVVFVNKIDRMGARFDEVVRSLGDRLELAAVPMVTAIDQGARGATTKVAGAADPDHVSTLVEQLSRHDDEVLRAFVGDEALPYPWLRTRLAAAVARGQVNPVYAGSAITGAGVEALTAGVVELLAPADDVRRDAGGPADTAASESRSGSVFKIERGPSGEKIAYVRMFTGALRTRDRLPVGGREGKVTAIEVITPGASTRHERLVAGQIGKVWGFGGARVGDPIGQRDRSAQAVHHFAPPTLETVVVPVEQRDRGALLAALAQLAEQDPLIDVRQDDVRQQVSVKLYGEVQKEVIAATLAGDFGLKVEFEATTTVCVERLVGSGHAVEFMRGDGNPFLATIGLRVEPAPIGSGVSFGIEYELGALPLAFLRAVEETVHEALQQGIHGWEVIDGAVTMTHSGYAPRQSHAHATFDKSMSSTAGDFRGLTPLVLMAALRDAGTRVHEPIHRFRLELPADSYGGVMSALAPLGAVATATDLRDAWCVLDGEVPAASVHDFERQLPTLTSGEGVLEATFDHFRPVRGPVPSRARTDANPLHRKEYLLRVLRRV